MTDSQEMQDIVKAMANADQLRVIAVLAERAACQSEIAGRLNMSLRDAIDHLSFLEHVGVIHLKDKRYELDVNKVKDLARNQVHVEKEKYVPAPGLDEKMRKVLVSCLEPDGTIKRLPSQPSRFKAILNYIVQAFTPGANFTEKEVNTILRRFYVDVSSLRRYLVDAGLLDRKRDGSRYWRTQ